MMPLALTSNKVNGKAVGIAAPVRGLNTEAPLAGLAPQYAVKLDNWVCQPDALVTRPGAASHATGLTGGARSLMVYSKANVSQMFAATASGIYNVSSAGAVGATVLARTVSLGKSVNFATSAGQFLYFCNGTDSPALYDGTTWTAVTGASSPAITGPTTSTFFDVETYRQRLYFLQNDFLGFYYLPADSVGGAATAFRVGSLCRLGGKVVAHGTWTIDGGNGPDDHYALATSEGEVLIFRGNDPAVVSNWSYLGTYYVGKPVGQYAFAKLGGDLLYLCENGVIPLSKMLQSTTLNYAQAVTSKVAPSIAGYYSSFGTLAGWSITVVPKLSLLLLNIPQSTTLSLQYCYNTKSMGWSTFSGWNASSWAIFGGEVYFTTGEIVAKAFTGTDDFGNNITAICDTSYNRFGTREQLLPSLIRVLFGATAEISYTVGLAQDFSGVFSENNYTGSGGAAGRWDTGLWDTAMWGGTFTLRRDWVTVSAIGGLALSTRFKVSSKFASSILLAVDYKFLEQGLVS